MKGEVIKNEDDARKWMKERKAEEEKRKKRLDMKKEMKRNL